MEQEKQSVQFGSIMVIIIISSVLRSITDGLENKSVSQITYYITYILIVTIVMKNFSDIINMVKTSIDNLVAFTNCLIPGVDRGGGEWYTPFSTRGKGVLNQIEVSIMELS